MPRFKAPLKPLAVLQKLQQAKTTKSQERVVTEAWNSDSEEFFVGFQLAVDPTVKFNVPTVPEIQDTDDGSPGTFSFADFIRLSNQLKNQELTGEAAQQALAKAACEANISEWNLWYRKILLKTLQAGLPMDTILKTLSRLTSI
jgi:hypothetical protein